MAIFSHRLSTAFTRSTTVIVVCMAVSSARADIDSAKSDLSKILGFAAKTTQKYLVDDGQKSIALGTIANRANTSSGTYVAKVLEEKLSTGKNPLQITPDARYQLSGEYYSDRDKSKVKFEFKLRDTDSGLVIDRFAEAIQGMEIDNRDEVASLLGLTKGPAGGGNTDVDRVDASGSIGGGEIADTTGDTSSESATDSTQATFDGSVVYPSGSRDYGIEILVKRGNRYESLSPDARFDYPFVDLPVDATYAVRVVNNTTKYVALNLRIDGLSVFEYGPRHPGTFKPGDLKYSHMLIAPGKSEIKGWFISNTRATEFLVSSIGGDGNGDVSDATRRQDNVADIGTITAMFYPAITGRGGKQTIQGQEVSTNYKTMQASWSDTYHSVVSVRYDK